MGNRRVLFAVVALCSLVIPSVAVANAGVPMIGIVYPGMGLLLIPVILIEIAALRRRLGIAIRPAATAVTVSNLVSTLVGVPVTWIVLVVLQAVTGGASPGPSLDTFAGKLLAVTWQAAWMMPYESDLYWMVPAAAFVLLAPFFFVSWLIEYNISRPLLRGADRLALKRAVLIANVASYALLAAVTLAGLAVGIYQHVSGI